VKSGKRVTQRYCRAPFFFNLYSKYVAKEDLEVFADLCVDCIIIIIIIIICVRGSVIGVYSEHTQPCTEMNLGHHFGKQIINTRKILKCVSGEGWRKSTGRTV